uniref:FAD-binding FR-type domain-containing protein n=1 Tax=Noctiluca scintillans TaxID=2966 RepID=A0A7S1EXR3_NOCSC|mmetsp:Transcript_15760/g.42973  ORF Transcript_15760/g.42973 Transcript_15760/m.42973 type:complete len:308 (+) Transcript_15760:114-1037(+)
MEEWLIYPVVGITAAAFAAYVLLRPRKTVIFLDKTRKLAQIVDIHEVSHDTKRFRLSLGGKRTVLGLPVGKHLMIYFPNAKKCTLGCTWNGRPDPDGGREEIERKYTPITGDEALGYVDLMVKIYRPGTVNTPGGETVWEDGGKCSGYLDEKRVGDSIDLKGPFGFIEYLGCGKFKVPGGTRDVRHVAMIAGGSGITPMLQVLMASLRDKDECQFSMIYGNKTKDDILCKPMLDTLKGRLNLTYTLDYPPLGWTGKTGFITADMVKEALPSPEFNPLVLLCGPPGMMEAARRNLDSLGYDPSSVQVF